MSVYLADLAIINALGSGKAEVLENLLRGDQSGMQPCGPLLTGRFGVVGRVTQAMSKLSEEFAEFDCRNNQLLVAAAAQIEGAVNDLKSTCGAHRIAVLVGTSTSGIAAAETALIALRESGHMPAAYHYRQQEIGTAAEFLARYLGIDGPRYTISTACSSSAKALGSAERLLDANLCDAVVVGGCDSLCELTINGFDALEAMSDKICNPFSANRDGINIGEGAALFLMTRTEAPIRLAGVGESSDAYHVSAPEPSGKGAELAIRAALAAADAEPRQIAYVNLHGTATIKNDEMESRVIDRVFGPDMPCSSTKSQIGHTLGAAGAQEVGLCWLLLNESNTRRRLPQHLWDHEADRGLPSIGLTGEDAQWRRGLFMSNSFAFGGSNVSVVLGRS
ncbi:MAG: beta-ketoacyl-[acyl-carrier-protein] synthase family protein [Gammaproteobacteria bacterium]|nr:beta-ketoacyl-[acyl-carrier-protein] synthase family protein [Gammaproteobacteria bacterium]MDH3432554.1 beta-ketoacyl-[acyl-carrier-protein] synthase family protein [Gammaproteobacteria bacterium]